MADFIVSALDYVYPLIGYEKGKTGTLDARQVYGTAFSIGKDLYLTARHSLDEARKLPSPSACRKGVRWEQTRSTSTRSPETVTSPYSEQKSLLSRPCRGEQVNWRCSLLFAQLVSRTLLMRTEVPFT